MVQTTPEPNSPLASAARLQLITNWPRWREGQAIRLQQLLPLNLEAPCALMKYLLAPTWEDACKVLEGSLIHSTGWPAQVLKDMVDGGRLSKKDVEVFCQHIAILELVREIGLNAARALLTLH